MPATVVLTEIVDASRAAQHEAGHALLRALVAQECGVGETAVQIKADGLGRPIVAQPVHVSLAHSGCWVAAAVATEPIGVDVQIAPQRRSPGWLRALNADDVLPALGVPEQQLQVWTQLEAVAKADGRGVLGSKARRRAVGHTPMTRTWEIDGCAWTARCLELTSGHALSVAMATDGAWRLALDHGRRWRR